MLEKRIDSAYWALRIAYGAVPIVAGLDKFTNLLIDWTTYLSPFAARLLPVSPVAFMRAVGVVEIAVGLLVLFVATRVGAWLAAAWLACIALQIVTSGQHLDVAVRDAVMALGAYTLARLEEVRRHSARFERVETARRAA
ncbi:MAG TPA: DoxX family membrane protein [Anaeromyxobacteraceae bacterium]|nr:DoxX family membrane protein [Anaeromyxobacteraceae bacterium]